MYKLEGGVSYDYTPTYDELYDDYKRGAIDKNALIDLAQKRKELDYKEANMQQLKDTALSGVRAVIGGGLEGASFHPFFNIPYVGTGLGGALFEWGDSINNKRSAVDTLKNMGKGFAIGETVGAIPYAGKAIGKTKVGGKFGDVANKAYQRIADTSIGAKMGQGLNKVGDLLMTDVKAFNPNKQVAWHGSPVDFDKFDNAYIGTGEGAQAHGYGHYAAKNKDVADIRYRKGLSGTDGVYKYKDEILPEGFYQYYNAMKTGNENTLPDILTQIGQEMSKTENLINRLKNNSVPLQEPKDLINAQNLLSDYNKIFKAVADFENVKLLDSPKGRLYKLSIPQNDVMLREDLQLSQQPNILKKLNIQKEIELQTRLDNLATYIRTNKNNLSSEKLNNLRKEYADLSSQNLLNNPSLSGGQFYDVLADKLGNKQLASEYLLNKGIKGISYNGGIDGEANVIFNPDDIDIVRKYYNQPQAMEYFKSINPNLGAETEAINNGLVDKKYWKQYAKDNMIGKSVDVPDYTTVNFTNKNLNKDYLYNMPEYPTLFDQLAGSKYAFSTNYKNEPDRLYDHLVNTNNNRLFDYLIEVIKDNDGNVHHNYKMMKNITRGDKP